MEFLTLMQLKKFKVVEGSEGGSIIIGMFVKYLIQITKFHRQRLSVVTKPFKY